jgi:hypothetical protein
MMTVTRTDNDGHKYEFPALAAEAFDLLLEKINSVKIRSDAWYDLNAELDNRFGKYMIG